MVPPHFISRCLLLSASCCAVAIGSHAIAGDTTQSPRPHSLIHRQAPEVATSDAGTPTPPLRSTPSAAASRQPHRKLTKRPAQLPMAGASTDTVTSQATAVTPKAVSPLPIQKTGTESRISMAATGLAQVGAPASNTAVATSARPSSAMSSVATAPLLPKTPVAAAVPGMGPGPAVPQAVATGRGLQHLTTQMPGLAQLTAPTVVVSSSPSTSQPPPSSFSPGTPPSSPSGTGTATLSWALNSEPDLAGYKIYVGTASGLYNYPGSPFVAGVASSYSITGLPSGQTYYFAISAYDNFGNESALSAEVSKSIY